METKNTKILYKKLLRNCNTLYKNFPNLNRYAKNRIRIEFSKKTKDLQKELRYGNQVLRVLNEYINSNKEIPLNLFNKENIFSEMIKKEEKEENRIEREDRKAEQVIENEKTEQQLGYEQLFRVKEENESKNLFTQSKLEKSESESENESEREKIEKEENEKEQQNYSNLNFFITSPPLKIQIEENKNCTSSNQSNEMNIQFNQSNDEDNQKVKKEEENKINFEPFSSPEKNFQFSVAVKEMVDWVRKEGEGEDQNDLDQLENEKRVVHRRINHYYEYLKKNPHSIPFQKRK